MSFLDDAKEALDKAEEFAKEHPDQIKAGLDKAKGVISEQTGGKYDSQINAAAEKAEGFLNKQ
jgi:hypothetical protein